MYCVGIIMKCWEKEKYEEEEEKMQVIKWGKIQIIKSKSQMSKCQFEKFSACKLDKSNIIIHDLN